MNCREFQKRIDEADDKGFLCEETNAHRAICASCRRLQSERVKLRELTDCLTAVTAPTDFDFVLRRRLRQHNETASRPFWLNPQMAFSVLSVAVLVGAMFALVPIFINRQTSEKASEVALTASPSAVAPEFTPFVRREMLPTPANTEVSVANNGNVVSTATPRIVSATPRLIPSPQREVAGVAPTRIVPKAPVKSFDVAEDDEILVRDSSQNAAEDPQTPSGINLPNSEKANKQGAVSWLNLFGVSVDGKWFVTRVGKGLQVGDQITAVNGQAPEEFASNKISDLTVEVLRDGRKLSVKIR